MKSHVALVEPLLRSVVRDAYGNCELDFYALSLRNEIDKIVAVVDLAESLQLLQLCPEGSPTLKDPTVGCLVRLACQKAISELYIEHCRAGTLPAPLQLLERLAQEEIGVIGFSSRVTDHPNDIDTAILGLATKFVEVYAYWHKSLEKDLEVLSSRLEKEGLGFATKILPGLGRAYDRSLDGTTALYIRDFSVLLHEPSFLGCTEIEGEAVPIPEEGLGSSCRTWTGVPVFMAPVFLMTHSITGFLRRGYVCTPAIRALRTVCYLAYKLEMEFSDEDCANNSASFAEVDSSLPLSQGTEEEDTAKVRVLVEARRLIHVVLANADPHEITPSHGPGSVAEGYKPWEKVHHRTWFPSVDSTYDLSYVVSGKHGMASCYPDWHQSDRNTDTSARVCFVPKDSRGPRTITCEPVLLQQLQQGQRQVLVDACERKRVTRRTRLEMLNRDSNHIGFVDEAFNPAFGYLNFTSQDKNRELARAASVSGKLATIDMKDASDRISVSLVEALFPSRWCKALFSTRSLTAELPDGMVLSLRKYAGMGNATTFPVEALCFWGLARATSQVVLGRPSEVWVYGDDIICAPELAVLLFTMLPEFGLKCNEAKSFVHGPFRESCGMDAFRGVAVTPLRIKKLLGIVDPDLHDETTVSVTALCNEAWDRGYPHLSSALRSVLDEFSPTVPNLPSYALGEPLEIGLTGVVTRCPQEQVTPVRRRWNKKVQQMQYFVPYVEPVKVDFRPLVPPTHRPHGQPFNGTVPACSKGHTVWVRGVRTLPEPQGWNLVYRGLTHLDRRDACDRASSCSLPGEVGASDQYTLPNRYKITWGWRAPTWLKSVRHVEDSMM